MALTITWLQHQPSACGAWPNSLGLRRRLWSNRRIDCTRVRQKFVVFLACSSFRFIGGVWTFVYTLRLPPLRHQRTLITNKQTWLPITFTACTRARLTPLWAPTTKEWIAKVPHDSQTAAVQSSPLLRLLGFRV